MSFIRIFIELYNCFTACFSIEFTIATDMPIYNQYQAVFFARRYVLLKYQPGHEVKVRHTCAVEITVE